MAARRIAQALAALAIAAFAAGCNMTILQPAGDVAFQQRNLIIAATALMLLVIVPVIAMCFFFGWRYRAANTDAEYDPDWDHSTQLEVVIWTIPLLIVIALGAMTWISTHTLDPYRPLGRIAPSKPVPPETKPLEVQVVSLDWKWLFIYPEQGIATVNEMAAPVDRPILFRMTSSSVWNTFWVPAIAGMVYTMPGMETKLHAVANREGDFVGQSAHYSGPGFSRMTFTFKALPGAGFDQWIAKARETDATFDRAAFLALDKPSEREPARVLGRVEQGLYDVILGLCVKPGQMCVHEMHHIDRAGGGGRDSAENRRRLEYDNRHNEDGREPGGATYPASGRAPRSETPPQGIAPRDAPGGGDRGAAPPPAGAPAPSQLNAPHRH
jgi:cytochrome o ubiquinol oxidase subunit II